MEINPIRQCPNCGSDSVEFFDLDGFGYGWRISTDSRNFIRATFCPDCGHELPDETTIKIIQAAHQEENTK